MSLDQVGVFQVRTAENSRPHHAHVVLEDVLSLHLSSEQYAAAVCVDFVWQCGSDKTQTIHVAGDRADDSGRIVMNAIAAERSRRSVRDTDDAVLERVIRNQP